jgi:CTP synthase (UTP-ammonia lyase)
MGEDDQPRPAIDYRMQAIRVALVGDHDESVLAHRAIPLALQLAGDRAGRTIQWDWCSTDSLLRGPAKTLQNYDCTWCVPGSPYRSEAGAREGIRFARETGQPFLGTCGGCQHAILEYARNVLGIRDADHAETHPDALLPLIAPLSCALVEVSGAIRLQQDSMIARIYGSDTIEEGYHCSYGLNPGLEHLLAGSALKISGRDGGGEARAFELGGRDFYILTQFQPERSALKGVLPPVVSAFVAAAAARRG